MVFGEVRVVNHISPELFEVVEWFAVKEDVGLVCDVLEFMDEMEEVWEVVVEQKGAVDWSS